MTTLNRRALATFAVLCSAAVCTSAGLAQQAEPAAPSAPAAAASPYVWTKLTTDAYPGKQDDIHFINPNQGWYVNGAGKIYRTKDGGTTWEKLIEQPGTFFRCVALLDAQHGFVGNIGPDYFPNVSDTTPLYRTKDGGTTWQPVTINGDPVKGLCSLEVVRYPFINAGVLGEKTLLVGGGRVGSPSVLIMSRDEGETWTATDMSAHCAMILDVHFFDDQHGIIAAASDASVEVSNALILTTDDGGKTWTKAYQSTRPFELTWKISFPSRQVGYVTIQSYNPDPGASQRFVAKTTDAGKTWTELPLVDDPKVRQFGVAFLNDQVGWVGAMPHGFETLDGGATWSKTTLGNAANKIRVVKSPDGGAVAYAIGVHVYKLTVPKAQ